MKTPKRERELVLLSKESLLSEQALEHELHELEDFFRFSESLDVFCKTHELAKRNGISRKTGELTKQFFKKNFDAFCFLICIN